MVYGMLHNNVHCSILHILLYNYTLCSVAYVYVSIKNTFPFGYNIPDIVKCLQLNEPNVIYALNGTLSIVLSEGYGHQHDEYRSNMKHLIKQEGYSVDNFKLFSLLTATYARESIAGIVAAIQHFISQNWPLDFMKSVLYSKQVKFTTYGLTGEVTFDKTIKEQNVIFTVYNIIRSIEETDNYFQPRAYINYVSNSVTTNITMNYVSAGGMNSNSPTIIYTDGTKNPPESQPEKFLPQSMIGKGSSVEHKIILSFVRSQVQATSSDCSSSSCYTTHLDLLLLDPSQGEEVCSPHSIMVVQTGRHQI